MNDVAPSIAMELEVIRQCRVFSSGWCYLGSSVWQLDVQLCEHIPCMLLIYQASRVHANFLFVAVFQLPRAKTTCKQQKNPLRLT